MLVNWLKQLSYASGMLHLYHRARNAANLTVVMFHRILDAQDPRWGTCNPEYTLSTEHFELCLDFFARHYNVVSVGQVIESRRGARALPKRALLITFDDGWADTADYALPRMQARGLPGVVFVAADAVDRTSGFHQENIYAAWRRGSLTLERLRAAILSRGGILPSEALPNGPDAVRHLIAGVDALPDPERGTLLEELAPALHDERRQMVTSAQLRSLVQGRIDVGCHGKTHRPLTQAPELEPELQGAYHQVAAKMAPDKPSRTMSFPHGRYDHGIVDLSRAAGFELLFTSTPILNPAAPRCADLLGRVGVDAQLLTGTAGVPRLDLLALNLFTRPCRLL